MYAPVHYTDQNVSCFYYPTILIFMRLNCIIPPESILLINRNQRLWSPSEKADFIISKNTPSRPPSGNELQQLPRATSFAQTFLF